MKKTLVILILTVVLLTSGCGPMTPEQRMAWGNFFQNYSQQQQNLADQQNMQLRENAREINRQLQQQNSWQERRAQQEYYQNWLK